MLDTEGLDDEVRPGSNNTRGRSTKFCMLKQNGDYADSYYCNVYHNCHGGFDTIQYCTRGLVSSVCILKKGVDTDDRLTAGLASGNRHKRAMRLV